ncbi:MAG: FGGY family carbohydrate kinase [Streptococcus sp.]|nr:FGGY family carbohydrate kinase [Streptococcus sp.]
MDSKFFVGLDIGTTSIKITVIDEQKIVQYEKQYHYHYDVLPNDWLEISPEIWKDIVIKAFDELFESFPCQISSIGITGQMHTTVFIDSEGNSIRPAILWNDMRTKNIIPKIKQLLQENASYPYIENILSNGSPLANILWLKENESENYRILNKIMMPLNYINYILSGEKSMDYCDASTTSLYDISKREWAYPIFEMFSLSKNLFPEVTSATHIIGNLKTHFLERWNQKDPVAIITGTGDNIASVIATTNFKSDQPIISLGTSGVLIIPDAFPNIKPVGKNVIAKIVDEDDTIITQGTVQSGAKVNSWWIEKILGLSDYSQFQEKIDWSLLGKNEVMFVPHLNGEKTLFSNPNLRGAFIGLGLETTKYEMYLSILEGIAFGMKMIFNDLCEENYFSNLIIVGGGAKSKLWVTIFANVFNLPIKHISSPCDAVYGAAILALMSQKNKYDDDWNQEYELIVPNQTTAQSYEKKYLKYSQLLEIITQNPKVFSVEI